MEDYSCNLYLRRENLAWAPKERRLPVTLVTGPLGAGKTTLLNHILNNKHNLKIAAAVNDFASINIDGRIIRRSHEDGLVTELTSGCLCCTVSQQFETAMVKLLQDSDMGKIDYLVIETSGVTDPRATVRALERQYGKLFRIRLDVVVTVIDVDLLARQLCGADDAQGTVMGTAAAAGQLLCADVVLLNKADLVSQEQLEKAEEHVKKRVPGVQVYACRNGAVSLDWIMEVTEMVHSNIVTHEISAAAYRISEEGGSKNRERRERLSKEAGLFDDPASHLARDDFASLTFVRARPFRLSAFQAFLGQRFPAEIVRMKGTLWFEENRDCLYQFHMSGRQRYELTPLDAYLAEAGGAFETELVVIGRGLDRDRTGRLLEGCLSEGRRCPECPDSEYYDEAKALVSQNTQFEVVEAEGDPKVFIDFRLTGHIEYGLSMEKASAVHGIDFNRMNAELVRRVNDSSGPPSLLPVRLPTGVQVCRCAVGQEASFKESWPLISQLGARVVTEFYRAVNYCKCGM